VKIWKRRREGKRGKGEVLDSERDAIHHFIDMAWIVPHQTKQKRRKGKERKREKEEE